MKKRCYTAIAIVVVAVISVSLWVLLTGNGRQNEIVDNVCPPALLWNNEMYYWTGEEIDGEPSDDSIMGEVTSTVSISQMPSQNEQANIPIMGAQIARYDGELVVWMEGAWILFELRV